MNKLQYYLMMERARKNMEVLEKRLPVTVEQAKAQVRFLQEQNSVMKPRKKLTCRCKFYADTKRGDINRLFCWKVNSLNDVPALIARFKNKGFRIRKIYFEYLDSAGKVIDNFVVPESVL